MQGTDERLAVIAGNLRVDAATAEVLTAFVAADLDVVLLKGPAIARWLYSEAEPRSYRDCDLLVRPDQLEGTAIVLAQLGFSRQFDDRDLPSWWARHSVEWWRAQDGVAVDVHRVVPGIGVEPEVAWSILTARTEVITVANHPARVLCLPARALHVALHAAQHGTGVAKPIVDLNRAIAQLDEPLWRSVVDIAARVGALPALATGLRLTPDGYELADRLDLTATPTVAAWLQASTAPPVALGLEQLARANGLRDRIAILRAKLIPPPSYIRYWHPIASRGRVGLLLAYLYRPLWILRSTPRAVAAWQRARRATRRTV